MILSLRSVASAGLVFAAALLVPSQAIAASTTVTLSPPVIQQGGTVEVRADCNENGGEATLLDGQSNSLAKAQMQKQPSGGNGIWGQIAVPPMLSPGTYTIFVLCSGAQATGTSPLTVLPRTPVTPTGPAKAGDGGAFSGPNTTLVAMGGVLIVAAVVGSAILVRRRRHAHTS